ncbi:hypothetical protein BDK51DRAFT_48393 [Blyttiomyces helicus]|uniref:Uncharacterized protein n=1 Tax=Blyttiomyces helicus TaxID=388810 RepID=A0A4P9VZL3_9FUNG|nr:hypothetical protein BDK51DRAFT_48393 [Blyttiomyces helicus]|eukprot:RKO84233.1 hypothetical protein BDK51DRAFT_48393 [Blyttiomyces helicus]
MATPWAGGGGAWATSRLLASPAQAPTPQPRPCPVRQAWLPSHPGCATTLQGLALLPNVNNHIFNLSSPKGNSIQRAIHNLLLLQQPTLERIDNITSRLLAVGPLYPPPEILPLQLLALQIDDIDQRQDPKNDLYHCSQQNLPPPTKAAPAYLHPGDPQEIKTKRPQHPRQLLQLPIAKRYPKHTDLTRSRQSPSAPPRLIDRSSLSTFGISPLHPGQNSFAQTRPAAGGSPRPIYLFLGGRLGGVEQAALDPHVFADFSALLLCLHGPLPDN